MRRFLDLSDEQKRQAMLIVAKTAKVPVQAVEKDVWVTNILQAVFSMPIRDCVVFKGGTSLSKAWNLIERFSEDIDLAIDRNLLGVSEGELTKKQLKKLRKSSSLFVAEEFAPMLTDRFMELELDKWLTVKVQPNGEGDGTYPEPRQIFIHYNSVFDSAVDYLRSDVVLEIGARSLMEPIENANISSIIGKQLPIKPLIEQTIPTSVPEKTFIEKIFLLHEIFSTDWKGGGSADRKSRHLYDLYQMKNKDFAEKAISDDALWESIRHHREVFTPISGFDYTRDIRKELKLIPDDSIAPIWKNDYSKMCETMIYGTKPNFEELLDAMAEIQDRFKSVC